ncbi:hypothetical protein RC533_000905 [Salmonella enterica]|uniref:hypothetical protein n=1 Tax=Enterobacteriaceae TaxID=543 RepID=UPI001400D9CE|nr:MULTISPECIES: hypothetical protein [Klebsiella/Raoultella group]EBE0261343.1 hypothetical protein [Salmonella enterica]EDC9312570.1 hypothetical protein [Salmonella enterica subsp. enterica serovar Panama]ECO9822225.1 hypothetical protein [Salmonella enterica]EDT8261976.1 hypothetical protein [Salmonella enterica]EGK2130989.1 hypothetical protein [Salmonella enterica]
MNNQWVYRVDLPQYKNLITDGFFRAKIWKMSPDDYPHRNLISILQQNKDDENIYRMCFYSTYSSLLKNEFQLTHVNRDTKIISRCRYNDILAAGFCVLPDHGFNSGEAYLFWVREAQNDFNSKLSNTGIDTHHMQSLYKNNWREF